MKSLQAKGRNLVTPFKLESDQLLSKSRIIDAGLYSTSRSLKAKLSTFSVPLLDVHTDFTSSVEIKAEHFLLTLRSKHRRSLVF